MVRRGVRRTFRLRSGSSAADVDEEILFHIEMRIEQLVRRGLSRDEATEEALRRFGPLLPARESILQAALIRERRMRFTEWLEALHHDLRFVMRQLGRAPAFTTIVIVTLALGIGANAAMFGIVDRLLLRGPAHVKEPHRLMRLYQNVVYPTMGEITNSSFGYVTYKHLRGQVPSISGIAAFAPNDQTLGRGADARPVEVTYATADFFDVLGVHPALGRFYGADEDSPDRPADVAVIDYGFWQREFGGRRDVLGKTLIIRDKPCTIIGVTPEGFTGTELEAVDLWMPMSLLGARVTQDWTNAWDAQWLRIVARLAPGATPEQASLDATRAHQRTFDKEGTSPLAKATLRFRPLWYARDGKESKDVAVSRWLVGVAAIVLLVACANVANLLLARSVRRRREVAIRLALGIGRARLMRLLLAESAVLALAGGAAGLLVARWGGSLMRGLLLPGVTWTSSPVDGRVLLFTLAAVMLTTTMIGLAPALQSSQPNLAGELREGSQQGGGTRSLLRTSLTVAQAALSVMLLVGAGLFVTSLRNVRAVNLGIQPERVVRASINFPAAGDVTPERHDAIKAAHAQTYRDALERVKRLRGVEHAALVVGLPFNTAFAVGLKVPGVDSIPPMEGGGPYISAITSDYFATVGTPLLRGRAFTDADRAGSARVAIVSDLMARTLWPGKAALGQCLIIGDTPMPCSTVVGVVADAHRFSLKEPPAMQYYIPLGQESGFGGTALLARVRSEDPGGILGEVRREIRAVDPTLGYIEVGRLQEAIDPQVRPWKLGATMFGIFGGLALLVASIGLYSVISYLVTQRMHELGVRIALGAQSTDIVRLIMRYGLVTAAIGVAIGLGLSLAAGRMIESMLFDVSPRDPAVLVTVAGVLLLVALIASIVPAMRATRVDPVTAIRTE
jgi:predicted permease